MRHVAQILSFSFAMLLIAFTATAQPGFEEVEVVERLMSSVAGDQFDGNPCSLTVEQRREIDRLVEEELGYSLHFAEIPCDSFDSDWQGGGDDVDGHGNDDRGKGNRNPGQFEERFLAILHEVAGEDFQGDPCELTTEQREEINAKLTEEFGEDCPVQLLCPDDIDGGDDHGRGGKGGRGHQWDDQDMEALNGIIIQIAGEDFDGNPCGLTEEQRAEIDRLAEEELGYNIHFAEIPCDSLDDIFGDEWMEDNDHQSDHQGGMDGIDPSEVEARILAILREVAGEDFEGDPCDLTEEQREEINARLFEEFGDDCPIQLVCPDDIDGGNDNRGGGDIDLSEQDIDRLITIVLSVAGDNFDGDPCSLTEAQREEIDRLIEEEFGINLHFAEIPCGVAGGNPIHTDESAEQAESVLQAASQKLADHKIIQQKAFPNPITSNTTVEFRGPEGSGRVSVINSRGQTIISHEIATVKGTNSVELNMTALLPGSYFVVITVENVISEMLPVVVQ